MAFLATTAFSIRFSWIAAGAAILVLGSPSTAQVFNCTSNCHLVSGNVSDGIGGPFLAGHVYIATNYLTVPPGTTLTIQSGAVVKMVGVFAFSVSGTLNVTATAGQPAIITSFRDDIVADHNGDGSLTSPGPGDWIYVNFTNPLSNSQVTGLSVRYAGYNGTPAILVSAGSPVLSQCATVAPTAASLDLSNNSFPTVSACGFSGGTKPAVNVPIAAVAGFSSNTCTGQSTHDAMEIQLSLGSGSAVVLMSNTFNQSGAIVVPGYLTVASGATLTLGAGVALKFTAVHAFTVEGTLITNGTPNTPTVLTSIHDDVHGGDTNRNAASTLPAAGQWIYLRMNPTSDSSLLQGLLVRCAGYNGTAGVLFNQSSASATGLRTQLCGGPCVDLNNNSHPTLTNCAFDGGTLAATNIRFADLSGFTGCTASGNASYDAPLITAPSTAAGESPVILAANGFNGTGVFVIPNYLTVAANSTLTLEAGATLKFTGVTATNILGTLITNGTDPNPVTLTSIFDDVVGGDTNKDGTNTSGVAGQWIQLYFGPTSSASVVTGARIRCAGYNGSSAISASQSSPTLIKTRTALSGGPCIDANNNATPNARFCDFSGGTYAATNFRLAALAGLRQCTASGNSLANAPRITSVTVAAAEIAVVRAINTFNGSGAIHLLNYLTVAAGGTLDLGPGVVAKMENVTSITVSGTILSLGSGSEPVVFTSIHDDAFGGDSNANGNASVPLAGQWIQMYCDPTATGQIKHTRIRYAGYNGSFALRCTSAAVTFDADRVDRSNGDGFRLEATGGVNLDNLVAWNCAGTGINVDGAKTIRHATVTSCGIGIRNGPGATGPGSVINSISYGNTTANFAGFAAGAVTYSDGVAGGAGNLNALPNFVDAPSGDLTLQSISPCIDVAEVNTAFGMVFDHVEGSRLSDGRLIGVPLPDLGAYELAPYRLVVTGHPWSFETISATVLGPPGTTVLAIGVPESPVPLYPWGFLLVDALADLIVIAVAPAGATFSYNLPDQSASAGVSFGLQALGVPAFNPTIGGFTNLYRGVLDG